MILSMQVVGLFFGIWFTTINVSRVLSRDDVPAINFMVMSAGWTLFITVTWLI